MINALVVGYGSIGQRHARVLRELGCKVAVVSRRQVPYEPCFATITEAVASQAPDYVVVANETSAHLQAVEALRAAGFKGRLLIEKPLGGFVIANNFAKVGVGYNLRFHPVLVALYDALVGEHIVAIQVYCGQHLPTWRPNADYRTGYSADPGRGGGALRDLSHELDYLLWLAGPWLRVAAIGGHLSPLEIASDDCWGMLLELDRCDCATLQVNYVDRLGRRQIVVNTANHTFGADLILGTLQCDRDERKFVVGRDETYTQQHLAMLGENSSHLCTLAEGERVMTLVAAAEQATRRGAWMVA